MDILHLKAGLQHGMQNYPLYSMLFDENTVALLYPEKEKTKIHIKDMCCAVMKLVVPYEQFALSTSCSSGKWQTN